MQIYAKKEELKKAKAEYEVNALFLRKSVEGSRSPAVKKLAQAQWSYLDTMARLLEDQSVSQLCLEEGTPEEDRAEAAALYAEYAMDFATQSAQYAMLAAMAAMELQLNAKEKLKKRLSVRKCVLPQRIIKERINMSQMPNKLRWLVDNF